MTTATVLPKGVYRFKPDKRQADTAFPLGLGISGVHEVCEAAHGDMAALTGFALTAIKLSRGAAFWVSGAGLFMDHGQVLNAGFGQLCERPPAVLSAIANKQTEALWIIEEAIRSNAVSVVIAEIETIDFTASRRLTLAASKHGVPVFLLMPYGRQGSTAATARWRIATQASTHNRFDRHALGNPRWQAVLERSRQAPHMAGCAFDLEWNDEKLSLGVVSRLATHAPEAVKASRQDGQPPPARTAS